MTFVDIIQPLAVGFYVVSRKQRKRQIVVVLANDGFVHVPGSALRYNPSDFVWHKQVILDA